MNRFLVLGKYLKAKGDMGQVFLCRTVLHCRTGIHGLYLLKVSSVPLIIVTIKVPGRVAAAEPLD